MIHYWSVRRAFPFFAHALLRQVKGQDQLDHSTSGAAVGPVQGHYRLHTVSSFQFLAQLCQQEGTVILSSKSPPWLCCFRNNLSYLTHAVFVYTFCISYNFPDFFSSFPLVSSEMWHDVRKIGPIHLNPTWVSLVVLIVFYCCCLYVVAKEEIPHHVKGSYRNSNTEWGEVAPSLQVRIRGQRSLLCVSQITPL